MYWNLIIEISMQAYIGQLAYSQMLAEYSVTCVNDHD